MSYWKSLPSLSKMRTTRGLIGRSANPLPGQNRSHRRNARNGPDRVPSSDRRGVALQDRALDPDLVTAITIDVAEEEEVAAAETIQTDTVSTLQI